MATTEPENRETIRARLDELEGAIEDLRHAFDKYFCGVDRVPPARKRDRVQRRIRELHGLHIPSTAMRFRLQGLRARFVTYSHYWNRVLDQIERGVHRRDLQARRARETVSSRATADETTTPVNGKTLPDGGGVGQDVRALFDQLVRAKQAAGEATEGLTLAALTRKLEREAPKLEQQHGCAVRFEVATIRGKVRLRARPA